MAAAGPISDSSLAGSRVLVTGGSSGIGLATAHALNERGARLALLSRGGEGLAEAGAGIEPPPLLVHADVTNPEEVCAAIDRAAAQLGGLDAVIANAGAATYGPFAQMSPADYRQTIDTVLTGTLHTAHAALPHLERSRGTLVAVGSVAGRVPTPWLAAYSAAKHGVRGFIRSLDTELRARGTPVSLALIAPGPVDTPFWKRARTTDGRLPPRLRGTYRPEDVAAEILRALDSPKIERHVGGLMAAVTFADAVAPRLSLRALGIGARLGWRQRSERPPSPPDGLAEPAREAEAEGDLHSRPSIARRLRRLIAAGRE